MAILLPNSRNRLLNRLAELCGRGKTIYFDCNYRSDLWHSLEESQDIYNRIFPLAHTVLLNVEEGVTLLGRHISADLHTILGSYGVHESVIRDGGNPCSISCDGQVEAVSALPLAQVVDTAAAGDSFSAAYIMARRLGKTAHQAVHLAHQMAAYVISHKGAVAPRQLMPFSGETLAKSRMNSEISDE